MKSVTDDIVESFSQIDSAEVDDVIEGSEKDTVWVYPKNENNVNRTKEKIDETIDKYFINTECTVQVLDEGPIEVEVQGTI